MKYRQLMYGKSVHIRQGERDKVFFLKIETDRQRERKRELHEQLSHD